MLGISIRSSPWLATLADHRGWSEASATRPYAKEGAARSDPDGW
jgi:hypothetical protein